MSLSTAIDPHKEATLQGCDSIAYFMIYVWCIATWKVKHKSFNPRRRSNVEIIDSRVHFIPLMTCWKIQKRERWKRALVTFAWQFIWCRREVRRHATSNALETNPFRSQLSRRISSRFVGAFDKSGTRKASDPCRRLCWWRRCKWPAFARRELSASIRSTFLSGGQAMHLSSEARKKSKSISCQRLIFVCRFTLMKPRKS